MIEAVTVNHNTSSFAELMLRSLLIQNKLQESNLNITLLDNASDDEGLDALRAFLKDCNIPLLQTGFDTAVAIEKHGLALANFVESTLNASHYLFLDVDMWFTESDTISRMMQELTQVDNCFANQARIFGYYADRVIEGRDGVYGRWDGESFSFPTTVIEGIEEQPRTREYMTSVATRCSPVCCLIKNSEVFRRVVAEVGLTPATIFGNGEAVHYDTFTLMTHVMATHGWDVRISEKTVRHFTETAYRPEFRAVRDRDCQAMLHELRSGRSMDTELFRRSNWRDASS